MKLSRIILAVFVWLSALSAWAQAESGNTPAYRYLFVIDTSSGMKRTDELLPTIVHDMIFDGIGGKMQAGDVYGIWTFNEEVDTLFLPPMVWLPNLARKQALSVDLQIRDIHFKGKSDPAAVIQALGPVIKRAKDLTVVMLTDGSGVMFGTPYDLQITSIYRQYYHDMTRSHRPFITSLLTRDGKWMAWTVNAAGNNPGIPVLPPRPKPVEEVKAIPAPKPVKKAEAPPPAPKKPVESIIVKGPLHPEPKTVAKAPKKAPANNVPNQPVMKPVETAKAPPQPKPAPAKVVDTSAAITAEPAPVVTKTENVPAKTQMTPVPAKPAETKQPETAANTQLIKPVETQATKVEEYQPPAHVEPKPVVEAPQTKTATVTENVNKPAVTEPVPVKKVESVKSEPVQMTAKSEDQAIPAKTLEPAAQLAQTAVVPPPATDTNWGRILLGALFLLAAVLMLWLYTRKNTVVPAGSMISRSLDKEKRS